MRIDHIAFRTKDRFATANFFIECFNYRIADDLPDGFEIKFDDNSIAKCLVLVPSELKHNHAPWISEVYHGGEFLQMHMAPEIFISDGDENSIVGQWVKENGSKIHHIAYQVDDVEKKCKSGKKKGMQNLQLINH